MEVVERGRPYNVGLSINSGRSYGETLFMA